LTRRGPSPGPTESEDSSASGADATGASGSSAVSASEALEAVLEKVEGDEVSVGQLIDETEGRAHGIVLLTLSVPEAVPMIGLSAVLALPILGIGVVLLVKGGNPPIPRWVRERTFRRKKVDSAIRKVIPALRRVERGSRPRWPRAASASRVHGLICIAMSVILAIPVPGINALAALAVGAVGLGILQRDGLAIAVAGALATFATLGFVAVFGGVWSRLAGG
jgi:hypothetical protein